MSYNEFKKYNNKEIINNIINKNINPINKELNIYKDKEYINMKKEILYNNLKQANSFSSLIGAISSTRTTPRVSSTPTISTPPNTQPQVPNQPVQPQVPTQQVTQTPTTSSQGQSYDADKMWSPQSWKGNIYEWNRGVISIGPDGKPEKENLDLNYRLHHGGATVRTLRNIGITIQTDEHTADSEPFKVALEGAENGAIVFQSEGDEVFLYFPESITENQLESLTTELAPRQNFNFSFTRGEELFPDQNIQEVLTFAVGLKDLSAGVSR